MKKENESPNIYARTRYFGSMREPHISMSDSSRLLAMLEENLPENLDLVAQVRAIRASEFKHRTILEELDLGYMEVGLEGEVVHVHPRFLAMTGFTEEELVGTKGEAMLDEEGTARMAEVVLERKAGKASSYEMPILHRDGHRMWFLITGAPIRQEDGTLTGSVGIHFDITQRKLLELETNRALTAEAYARNRERGLLMKMSHEIRTPINAINGMFSLMNNVPRSKEYEAIWQGAMRATAMLRKVVDDVLDLSRLEIGKSSVQLREVDVVDVTSGVAKMHHLLANEKGIHLECNCELDETQRVLDVDKWLQILTNLLGNAIKYTEEGVVSLVIRNHESKADWIVAEVSDEGKGIPTEHHARIFEPFGMLNADNPKEIHRMKEGSTGLGLSISRELARVMDGELTLVPQSVGACFQLSIPSKTWDKPTQLRATEDDHVNQVPNWNAEGMRVLLAEDNDINVLYAKALLDRWKVHVDVAPDGQHALDLMEGGRYDAILLDVQMPNMDGLETVRRIRARERDTEGEMQQVFMVTAFADVETREMAQAAGANGFLAKPFAPDELFDVLHSIHMARGESQ
tara:strand:- start:2591 stop:4315 length:1725 start_codon:yes stop_codon:yes gene_type:complete